MLRRLAAADGAYCGMKPEGEAPRGNLSQLGAGNSNRWVSTSRNQIGESQIVGLLTSFRLK